MRCTICRCGLSCLAGAAAMGVAVASMGGFASANQPEGEMGMEEMMEMMRRAAEPGEHHERMAPLVGTWDVEAKFWMGPGEPTVSTATSENEWLLGERYVGQHYSGKFMGMDFEGFGVLGYDKNRGEYASAWIDNLSTGVFYQHGAPADDPRKIVLEGEAYTPMGKTRMKHVTRIVSDDKHVLTFYEPDPSTGEMRRVGELTYTRAE